MTLAASIDWNKAIRFSIVFLFIKNKKFLTNKLHEEFNFKSIFIYKEAEIVSTSLLILFTNPTNTFPGPTSVKLVAPSAIICCTD